MQRSVRVNDTQLLHLADRAQYDNSMVSPLPNMGLFLFFFLPISLVVVYVETESK